MIFYFFIAFLIILCVYSVKYSEYSDDRIFVTAYDQKKYKVRNTQFRQETADTLAKLNEKILFFIKHLKNNVHDPEYTGVIHRLEIRYNPDTIAEGRIDKDLTSYTINKGEQVVFCLRTRDSHDKIYDDNLIFYVALHELSHIASVGSHHNEEFHRNFRFLIKHAASLKLFTKVTEKFQYCGLDIQSM